jgi:hypothetical protein
MPRNSKSLLHVDFTTTTTHQTLTRNKPTNKRDNSLLNVTGRAKPGPHTEARKKRHRPDQRDTKKPRKSLLEVPAPRNLVGLTLPKHTNETARAIHQHAGGLGRQLMEDTSALALRPDNVAELVTAIQMMHGALRHAYSASTTALDQGSNWKWWASWCKVWNTPPIRAVHYHQLKSAEIAREEFLLAAAIPYLLARMRSRGRARPLPSSAAKVIGGVRRIHSTLGYTLPPMRRVNQVVKGMCRIYVERHGPESLLPHRKEPLPFEVILKILEATKMTIILNRGVVKPNSRKWMSLAAMIAVLTQTGFRKAETISGNPHTGLTRANVWWLIDGKYHSNPTASKLAELTPGRDYLILIPPPSKADQFGTVWGNLPISIVYQPNMELNAATEVLKMELTFPVTGDQRAATPLFCDDQSRWFTAKALDGILTDLLSWAGVPNPKIYSWHSFRIQLACALLKARATPAQIQAICRWQSEESLMIYARLSHQDYNDLLTRAYGQQFDQTQVANMPCIDSAGTVASIQRHNFADQEGQQMGQQ